MPARGGTGRVSLLPKFDRNLEQVQTSSAEAPQRAATPDPAPTGLAGAPDLSGGLARLDPEARARTLIRLHRIGNHRVGRIIARDPPKDGAAPAAAAPAKTEGLVVDDGTDPVGPDQLTRTDFLARLRSAVSAAAEGAIGGSAWAAMVRPQVKEKLDAQYAALAARDAKGIEASVKAELPGAAGLTTASALINAVAAQAAKDVAAGLPMGKPEGDGGGIVAGAADLFGKAASILFKRRGGDARRLARDPAAIRDGLGPGAPLPGDARARMEQAFGEDFSPVRVHTDATAGEVAGGLDARAFTIGSDIAFAPGEYEPGSPVGDALLAHELAHVVQQRHARDAPATDHADEGALETEADDAAVHAVVGAYSGDPQAAGKLGKLSLSRLRSGLRLQRCKDPGDRVVAGMEKANKGQTATTGLWYWPNYLKHCDAKEPGYSWNDAYRKGYSKTSLLVRTDGAFEWKLADGAKPSAALKEWLEGLTIADCASVAVALNFKAILDEVGQAKFDGYFASNGKHPLVIGQWPQDTPLRDFLIKPEKTWELKPGDWFFFQNHPAYKAKHPGGLWQGENAVYEGDGKWSGFGASGKTEKEMNATLVEEYNKGQTPYDIQRNEEKKAKGEKVYTFPDRIDEKELLEPTWKDLPDDKKGEKGGLQFTGWRLSAKRAENLTK